MRRSRFLANLFISPLCLLYSQERALNLASSGCKWTIELIFDKRYKGRANELTGCAMEKVSEHQ